ncbi:MAG: tRNA (adenosine(37)-N6)-threonylcarbamoyltransferase complex ATPase subunit type 1 TsaE [Bacteroidales bacterium]
MKAYHITSISDIHNTAKQFLADFGHNQVFAFYGPMGSGKTTFIKAVCDILKVEDDVTSPSFAILNEYFTTGNKHICHFDFYRIEKPAEILHTGFEEYLDMADMIFIEWPENAETILPADRVNVHIEYQGDGRVMTVKQNN